MKTRQKKSIFSHILTALITFALTFIAVVILMSAMIEKDRENTLKKYNETHKTIVKQFIMSGVLVTFGDYNGERVYTESDVITMDTPENIKCIRAKEAQAAIEKCEKIMSACNKF